MDRRRMLIANSQQGGYVQDGLYLWLDSIESTLSTVWEDASDNQIPMSKVGGTIGRDNIDGSIAFNNGKQKTATQLNTFCSPYTIEVLVKISSLPNTNNLVGWRADIATYGRGNIGIEQNVIKFGNHTQNGWNNLYSNSSYIDNSYHLFTGIQNGTISQFYVDGVLVSERTGGQQFTTPNKNLLIGYYNDADSFIGNFHSVRLYNKVLTADEISQNYATDKARFNL